MSNDQLDMTSGEEIEIEALGIEVNSQPIELYKVFKIANLVNGGGEAKHIISEGYVAVNGEIETRKRRKIYEGDLIEFNQEYYVILCDSSDVDSSGSELFEEQLEMIEEQSEMFTEEASAEESSETETENGRKSINFF